MCASKLICLWCFSWEYVCGFDKKGQDVDDNLGLRKYRTFSMSLQLPESHLFVCCGGLRAVPFLRKAPSDCLDIHKLGTCVVIVLKYIYKEKALDNSSRKLLLFEILTGSCFGKNSAQNYPTKTLVVTDVIVSHKMIWRQRAHVCCYLSFAFS